ncbi:MAG: hypothetical protein Q7T01_02225 [bacterium]|nr:hypothetical protein [bacterium]
MTDCLTIAWRQSVMLRRFTHAIERGASTSPRELEQLHRMLEELGTPEATINSAIALSVDVLHRLAHGTATAPEQLYDM